MAGERRRVSQLSWVKAWVKNTLGGARVNSVGVRVQRLFYRQASVCIPVVAMMTSFMFFKKTNVGFQSLLLPSQKDTLQNVTEHSLSL